VTERCNRRVPTNWHHPTGSTRSNKHQDLRRQTKQKLLYSFQKSVNNL